MIKLYISSTAFVLMILCSCAGHKKQVTVPVDTTAAADIIYTQDEASSDPYHSVNFQMDLYQQQVSFYGFSETDGWKLFIKEDSNFTFEYNGTKTVFECSKPSQIQGVAGMRYDSKKILQTSDSTQQKKRFSSVTLIEQPAYDMVSNYYNAMPFKVVITVEDNGVYTSFSGSGFYIGNPVIHDIWVLDSLSGIKFSENEFPHGKPRLEPQVDGGSLYGFNGCSEFVGSFYFVKNSIQFNTIKANTQDCADISDEAFLALLSKKRFVYSFEPNGLKLTSRDGSAIFFKKVD